MGNYDKIDLFLWCSARLRLVPVRALPGTGGSSSNFDASFNIFSCTLIKKCSFSREVIHPSILLR